MPRRTVRKAEAYTRTRVRCPNCGEMGTLIVGTGLYPFVEHRYEPEINPSLHSPCWVRRDNPLVAAALEQRQQGAAA